MKNNQKAQPSTQSRRPDKDTADSRKSSRDTSSTPSRDKRRDESSDIEAPASRRRDTADQNE